MLEPAASHGVDFQFTHALIKETLLDEISITRQARMHARVALMLESFYSKQPAQQAAQLAYHFGEAENVLGSEKFTHYSLIAGQQSLAAYAHDDAIVHFERGLESTGGSIDSTSKANFLEGLGRAQMVSMRFEDPDEPIRNLRDAFELYISEGDLERALQIPQRMMVARDNSGHASLDFFSRALEVAPADSGAASLIQAKYGSGLALSQNQYHQGKVATDSAIEIAEKIGEPDLIAKTLFEQEQIELWALNMQKVSDLATRVVSLLDPGRYSRLRGRVTYLSAVAEFVLGHGADVVGTAQTAQSLATKVQDVSTMSGSAWIEAKVVGYGGDWDRSNQIAHKYLSSNGPDPRLFAISAKAAYETGDVAQTRDVLGQIEEFASRFGSRLTMPQIHAIGAPAEAAYVTRDLSLLDGIKQSATEMIQNPTCTPLVEIAAIFALGYVAVLEDDKVAAERLIGEVKKFGSIMSYIGQTDRMLALLSRTAGRMEDAVVGFDRAIEFASLAGYVTEAAWIGYELADTLFQRDSSGDRARAEQNVLLTESTATELGLRSLLERTSELESKLEESSTGYPAGLSTREVDVIRLVAAGNSNAEIAETLVISLSTVTHRMSSIFSKTGAGNRTEAAAFATHHDLT